MARLFKDFTTVGAARAELRRLHAQNIPAFGRTRKSDKKTIHSIFVGMPGRHPAQRRAMGPSNLALAGMGAVALGRGIRVAAPTVQKGVRVVVGGGARGVKQIFRFLNPIQIRVTKKKRG